MKYLKTAALAIWAVSLAACQTVQLDDTITPNRPTATHKKQMVEAAKEYILDPYSIRDAELSNQLRFPNGVVAYCGRFNSKNALGGYVGRQYVMVYFNKGILTGMTENANWCKSRQQKLHWNSFSQLNHL